MSKLIIGTSLVLFWAFYAMSGGADFEPRERVIVTQAPFAKPGERQPIYVRPATAPIVTNAAYTPVETQTLVSNAVVITGPAPVADAPVVADLPETPAAALVYVAGNRVNLRRGPGTSHGVVDTLPQGTVAELLATNDNGWAQIRLLESGQTGWMAESLLSDS